MRFSAVEAARSGIRAGAHHRRPTQGTDEAVARIEMYAEEGADILFLDLPADDAEIGCAIAAKAGRFVVRRLARRAPRCLKEAAAWFQDRHLPDRSMSPATAGMKAGLVALKAGDLRRPLPPPELGHRVTPRRRRLLLIVS